MNTSSRIIFFLCLGSCFDKLGAAVGHVIADSCDEGNIGNYDPIEAPPAKVPLLLFSDKEPTMTLEDFKEEFLSSNMMECCSCDSTKKSQLHQHINDNSSTFDDEVELIIQETNNSSRMSLYAFLREMEERLKILAFIMKKKEQTKFLKYFPYVEKIVFKRNINAFNIVLARILVKFDFSKEEKKKLLGALLPVHKRMGDRVLCIFFYTKPNPYVVEEIPVERINLPESEYYQGHMNGLLQEVTSKLPYPILSIGQTYLVLFFLLLAYGDLLFVPSPLHYLLGQFFSPGYDPKYTLSFSPAAIYSLVALFGTTLFLSVRCYAIQGTALEKYNASYLVFASSCATNILNLGANLLYLCCKIHTHSFYSLFIISNSISHIYTNLAIQNKRIKALIEGIAPFEKQLFPYHFLEYKLTQLGVVKTFLENLKFASKKEEIIAATGFPDDIAAIVLYYSEPFKAKFEGFKGELGTYIKSYYSNVAPYPIVSNEQKEYLKRTIRHKRCIQMLSISCVFWGIFTPLFCTLYSIYKLISL